VPLPVGFPLPRPTERAVSTQAGGWGEVGRPNGSLGVGVELILFISLIFNRVRICKPLASTSKVGGFLFRAFGPQHTKVLIISSITQLEILRDSFSNKKPERVLLFRVGGQALPCDD